MTTIETNSWSTFTAEVSKAKSEGKMVVIQAGPVNGFNFVADVSTPRDKIVEGTT